MANAGSEFSFFFRDRAGHTIVDLVGSLDISTIQRGREMVEVVIHQGQRVLFFNMADINYIDSSGLGFLTGTLKILRNNQGDLFLFNLHPYVQRIFSLIQLDYFINTFDGEDEAFAFLQKGHNELIAKWRETARGESAFADSHFHLAQALFNADRLDEAAEEFEKAVAINPKYTAALLGIGEVMIRKGEDDRAVGYFERVIAHEPHNPRALVSLGRIYNDHEKVRQSIDLLAHAVEKNPHYADFRNFLGAALLLNGEPAKAVGEFRKALEINSRFVDARINLLQGLAKLKEWEEFQRELKGVEKFLVRPDQVARFLEIKKLAPA